MTGRSPRLSPGQSQVAVDVGVMLTWTFIVVPSVVLLLLPWRRLLSTERALLLLGVGLVAALLTVALERLRQSLDTRRRFLDLLATQGSARALAEIGQRDAVETWYSMPFPGEERPMSPEQWAELKRICL